MFKNLSQDDHQVSEVANEQVKKELRQAGITIVQNLYPVFEGVNTSITGVLKHKKKLKFTFTRGPNYYIIRFSIVEGETNLGDESETYDDEGNKAFPEKFKLSETNETTLKHLKYKNVTPLSEREFLEALCHRGQTTSLRIVTLRLFTQQDLNLFVSTLKIIGFFD